MPTYARIDDDNIVVEVNSGSEEWVAEQPGRWIETEPYVSGNINLVNGNTLRKNFGRIGYTYNEQLDAFVPPQTWNGWVLDPETAQWQSPTPIPNEGGNLYYWDNDRAEWALAGPGEAAHSMSTSGH